MKQLIYILLWTAAWVIGAKVAQGQTIDSSIVNGLRELGSRSVTGTFTDKDYNGISNTKIQKLNLLADQVKDIIPSGLIFDFKIFDFGMYSEIGSMKDSEKKYTETFDKIQSLIGTKYGSQNFLVVGRIFDPATKKDKVKIKLALPAIVNANPTGPNSQWTLTAEDLQFINNKIEEEASKILLKNGTIGGYEGTEKAMETTSDFFKQINKGLLHGENQYYFTPAGKLFYLQDPNKTNKPNEYRLWFWHHQDINGTLHGFSFSGKEYLAEFDASNTFVGYVHTDPITKAKLTYTDNHTYPIGSAEVEVNCLYKRDKICEGDAFKIEIKPIDLPLSDIKGLMALWLVEKTKANLLIPVTFTCTKAKLFIFDKLFDKIRPSVSSNAKSNAFAAFCKDLTDIADDPILPDFLSDFFPKDVKGNFSFDNSNETIFRNFFFLGKNWTDLVANDFILARIILADMKKARDELAKFPNTNLQGKANIYEFLKYYFGCKTEGNILNLTFQEVPGPFHSINGTAKAGIINKIIEINQQNDAAVYIRNLITTLPLSDALLTDVKAFYNDAALKNNIYKIVLCQGHGLPILFPYLKVHLAISGILPISDTDFDNLIKNKKEIVVPGNNINIDFTPQGNNQNIVYNYYYKNTTTLKIGDVDSYKADYKREFTISNPFELMLVNKLDPNPSDIDKYCYQIPNKPPVVPFLFILIDKHLKDLNDQDEVNKRYVKYHAILTAATGSAFSLFEASIATGLLAAEYTAGAVTTSTITNFIGTTTFATLDGINLIFISNPSLFSAEEQKALFYVYIAAIVKNIALGALTPTAESNIAKLENVLVNHANDLTAHEKQFIRAMLQRLSTKTVLFNFKTVEEAENYFKAYLGANITRGFKEIDLDVLSEIAERLTLLQKKFKHYGIKEFKIDYDNEAFLAIHLGNQQFIFHRFKERFIIDGNWEWLISEKSKGILHNAGVHFDKSLRLQITIDHEFSHLIHWNLHLEAISGNSPAATQLMDKYKYIVDNIEKQDWAKISKYANLGTKDTYKDTYFLHSEGFAEAFTCYNNGRADLLPIPLRNFFQNDLFPYITKK